LYSLSVNTSWFMAGQALVGVLEAEDVELVLVVLALVVPYP